MKTGKVLVSNRDFIIKEVDAPMHREFKCYWHSTGLTHISFGFHIDISLPNIEIHLPFGFLRFGCVWEFDEPTKEI